MIRLIQILGFLGFATFAFAMPAEDAMTAKVAVSDESSVTLKRALPEAFAQVLVNLTGNPDIVNQPFLAKQKPNVSSFLQNYTFVRENGPQGDQELFAKITFDKAAVDDFLQKMGQHAISPQVARLEIMGIDNLQDYLGALKAIKNIPEIKGVSVTDTSGSILLLSVEIQGGAQNLRQILSQNPGFAASAEDPQGATADLYYRWVKAS